MQVTENRRSLALATSLVCGLGSSWEFDGFLRRWHDIKGNDQTSPSIMDSPRSPVRWKYV